MEKRYGVFSSSTNPEELSATVSGIILALGALIIGVMGYFNIPLTNTQVAEFASGAGMAAGALWTLWGLGRKLVVFFAERD